jgi:Tol biopolymer transport system component/C-terminal processing protease CtpA/Prc
MIRTLLAALLVSAAVPALAQEAKPAFAEPSLSPDGQTIAFSSGGDIWEVPAAGGVARLLVTDAATDGRPLYSPDGTKLAFNSTRGGSNNIWVLDLASGAVSRLTWAEANEELSAWSPDGKYLYFSSAAGDIAGQPDIWRVAATGGTPQEISRERYLSEYHGAPSPDGSQLALLARGISYNQWWRNGTSHIDENEIWIRPTAAGGSYRQLLADETKHAWPMWSADGTTLWFMSDKSGTENLWAMPVAGGAPRQTTSFTDGRVLYPQIGRDGRTIVFERGFGIWRMDTATGQASPIPITLRGAAAAEGKRHLTLSSYERMAVSPDGQKLAVIGHGELFAVNARDGGQAQRITETLGSEREVAWSPDSRRILYTTERGTERWLAEYDVAAGRETLLTRTGFATVPVYAPDGKSAVYVQGKDQLRVVSLPRPGQAMGERTLFTGALATDDSGGTIPVWSPDGRWVAFPVTDRKSFTNVHVVPAAGGAARPVSFLANGQLGRIAWAPDGKYILFDTSQRSEDSRIVRVDLVPHVPRYREDGFRDLFKPGEAPGKPGPAAPAAPGPDSSQAAPAKPLPKAKGAPPAPARPSVNIVWDGLRERVSTLPLGLDAGSPVISPDGKTLIFVAGERGQTNLWSYDLDELADDKPVPQAITATPRGKGDFALTADGKTLFYLDGGTVFATPLSPRQAKPVKIAADMDVDFAAEKQVVFDQAWGTLNRNFYDAKFHGQDWGALRMRWQPYVAGARNGTELRRIMNLLIGQLDASHSGMGAPPGSLPSDRVGNLGLRFDRARYEAGDGLVVREVVTLSPAAIAGGIAPGDRITSVNGVAITPTTNLDALLESDVDRRVTLGVNGARQVVVRPVSQSTAVGLLYRQWVASRRALVDRLSGGRLGYVHLPDMGGQSLDQLYLDLDAENQGKQGVVVDIRNNNGGFINGYALDVFARRNFLTMTPRDLFPLPSRQALGQRALGLPTVLLTNESSLSDAEDFSEGWRTLGLGKIVGQPTSGWIIYTSNERLIDGSSVRVPSVLIQDLRGQNMEGNPRPVDVPVVRPLGETLTGDDAQLAEAVRVLLGQ